MNRKEDYLKLAGFLQNCGTEEITISFSQIEVIIEKPLPASAYQHSAWWGNNVQRHTHCVWLKVGYKALNVNLTQKAVTFCKE